MPSQYTSWRPPCCPWESSAGPPRWRSTRKSYWEEPELRAWNAMAGDLIWRMNKCSTKGHTWLELFTSTFEIWKRSCWKYQRYAGFDILLLKGAWLCTSSRYFLLLFLMAKSTCTTFCQYLLFSYVCIQHGFWIKHTLKLKNVSKLDVPRQNVPSEQRPQSPPGFGAGRGRSETFWRHFEFGGQNQNNGSELAGRSCLQISVLDLWRVDWFSS